MGSLKVLVVGGGGREHALVSKLASERNVAEVICVPGNPGIARVARCLAAGKGVVIARDLDDALSHVRAMMVDRRFGQAGARLVIEECLIGREASFFALCDGARAVPLGSAEDHKRALDGDLGTNTGGMG